MECFRAQQGETVRVDLLAVDISGAGVTGATVSLAAKRHSDGFWWNGTTYQLAYTTNAMSQLDATNLPGIYYADVTMPSADTNVTFYCTTATASIVNGPWRGEIAVGKWVDELDTPVSSRASPAGVWSYVTRTLTTSTFPTSDAPSVAFIRAQIIVILNLLKEVFARLNVDRR